jgi:hypothetical protein
MTVYLRHDGLAWLETIRTWSEAYEERCAVPYQDHKIVADETTALLDMMFHLPLIPLVEISSVH